MRHHPPTTECPQPTSGSQTSSVQMIPSLQVVLPTHAPAPSQRSPTLQALPSLQLVFTAAAVQPVALAPGSHTRHPWADSVPSPRHAPPMTHQPLSMVWAHPVAVH